MAAGLDVTDSEGLLVLYDGQCMVCSGWVRFLRKRDSRGIFRYASLQSEEGQAILNDRGLAPVAPDSMVTVAQGRALLKSTAGLVCLRYLPFPWPLCGLLFAIPRPLRDWVYDRVAKNRYRLGRQEHPSYTDAKKLGTFKGQGHE